LRLEMTCCQNGGEQQTQSHMNWRRDLIGRVAIVRRQILIMLRRVVLYTLPLDQCVFWLFRKIKSEIDVGAVFESSIPGKCRKIRVENHP
jgi:hypothetical protein